MNKTPTSRNTLQRRLILEAVFESCDHPTAQTVYLRVREKQKSISLGTVYRNLSVLSEQGKIVRLASPLGPDHYDFNLSEHYHFLCSKCGEMCDIPKDCEPSALEIKAPEKSGFDIHGHSLMYFGVCPSCKNKNLEVK